MAQQQPIFRKQEIPLGDKIIKLEFKPITEIFRFNEPPYIIVGVSGGGKTTLCIDLLTKFSKESTNIYYVTSTQESLTDDTISMIPKAFRRSPNYESLYNIWREIKAAYDATNVDPTKLSNMLTTLCGKQEATSILKRLEEKRKKIENEQLSRYRQNGLKDDEAIQNSKDDGKAFYIDTLTHLILDFAKTRGTRNFSEIDMLTLNSFISKAPKTMLLLDDVSGELEGLNKNKKKVNYEGQTLTVSDAYKSLIIDILTRGRHYGALICLFLHSIDILQQKSYINNLVLLNTASAQKVCNARTFPDEMRKIIGTVSDHVFNSEYPYHFLYISNSTGEVAVGKADQHINEELQLSPSNRVFVKIFNDIFSGVSPSGGGISGELDDESEYEYEYEDEAEGGGGDGNLDNFIKSIA